MPAGDGGPAVGGDTTRGAERLQRDFGDCVCPVSVHAEDRAGEFLAPRRSAILEHIDWALREMARWRGSPAGAPGAPARSRGTLARRYQGAAPRACAPAGPSLMILAALPSPPALHRAGDVGLRRADAAVGPNGSAEPPCWRPFPSGGRGRSFRTRNNERLIQRGKTHLGRWEDGRARGGSLTIGFGVPAPGARPRGWRSQCRVVRRALRFPCRYRPGCTSWWRKASAGGAG